MTNVFPAQTACEMRSQLYLVKNTPQYIINFLVPGEVIIIYYYGHRLLLEKDTDNANKHKLYCNMHSKSCQLERHSVAKWPIG